MLKGLSPSEHNGGVLVPPSQVQNARPVWGLVLHEHRAKDLFREMKRDPQLRALLYGCCEVTIYALEE